MELYKATATLFLDTRKAKANGRFPLKLTIYHRSDKKRYKTNIDLSELEWKKLNSARLKDEKLKDTKIKTQLLLAKAEKVIDNLSEFSFAEFEKSFFYESRGKIDLSLTFWFEQYITQLEKEGREGTRSSYRTTLNSLLAFKPNLNLTDITKTFLEDYEDHMQNHGKSPSTIGIYLRQLRAIINKAIEAQVLKPDSYAFKSYQIPASRNIKKALNDHYLQMLFNHEPSKKSHQKALAFWIFSYLCNGMNFTDIAYLQPENVNNNFLHYFRQKTIRTRKKDLRPIKVALHPRAKEIIENWKSSNKETPYLFPILVPGLQAKNTKNRIQRFIKRTNIALEEIRNELGIQQKVRGYEARHSYASRLMRKGASIALIKDSLGHSNLTVTENYLGDFEDSVKIEMSNLLTDFSNNEKAP